MASTFWCTACRPERLPFPPSFKPTTRSMLGSVGRRFQLSSSSQDWRTSRTWRVGGIKTRASLRTCVSQDMLASRRFRNTRTSRTTSLVALQSRVTLCAILLSAIARIGQSMTVGLSVLRGCGAPRCHSQRTESSYDVFMYMLLPFSFVINVTPSHLFWFAVSTPSHSFFPSSLDAESLRSFDRRLRFQILMFMDLLLVHSSLRVYTNFFLLGNGL